MWTSDLSDCWLNTPDVIKTPDDDVGGPYVATVNDLLDDFNVVAHPSDEQSFHHSDVTFQPTTTSGPLSPTTPVPLPVLQFYDTDAPLEEQLMTPTVETKTTQADFNTSVGNVSVADLSYSRPVSSTTFSSPLSEPHQELFMLIQLPVDSSELISILSRVTNNNEVVVDNNSSTETHHHHHQQQQQQQQQQQEEEEATSKSHISARTAADPCSGYQFHTSGSETGNDVTRQSEEEVMRMLDDAASIVSSECARRPASAKSPTNPLIDLSSSGLLMTSSSEVATLPVTSASDIDSQPPSDTGCNSLPRTTTHTNKNTAGRKRKQAETNCSAAGTSCVSRLERRREQNRRAARGSRERKRQYSANIVKDYQRELSLNTALNYELRQLKQQETTLLKLLLDHLSSCPVSATALAALSSEPETCSDISDISRGPAVSTGSVQI